MMNEALKRNLSESDAPVTEKVFCQVLRRELPGYKATPVGRARRSRVQRLLPREFPTDLYRPLC
jgi:hypothetical protein